MHAEMTRQRPRRTSKVFGLLLLAAPLVCPLALKAAGTAPLSADDIAWLRRDTFGLDSATIERYRELGRTRFLDEQLAGGDDPLPPAVAPLMACSVQKNRVTAAWARSMTASAKGSCSLFQTRADG